MNQKRLEHILENMQQDGLSQMIICDPATIFYLTGCWIHPGERMLVLLLRTDGANRLFVNSLFPVQDDLGVEVVRFSDTQDGVRILTDHTIHDAPAGVDKNWPARFLLRFMELGGASKCINASVCADAARSCKDTLERELMRAASRLNDACMAEFRALMREGITERECADSVKLIYARHGADGVSFSPIVAFGANAADAHHKPDGTRLKAGDCVLIDVGCVKDDYCSDMTRTFFYRQASARHKEIYELVRRANEAAEALVKPGVRMCDLDKAARDVITAAGYGENFTHRLGHSIGIECHEYGDVSASNSQTVSAGMIFSVEPGVYLENEVGVRIEDLVLVTENGCEILNSYSKELNIIE